VIPLTLDEVAAACGGRLEAAPRPAAAGRGGATGGSAGDVVVERVSTDSRTVSPGDLFIALKGEHFDGDRFAAAAIKAGAAAVAVRRETVARLPKRAAKIVVDDGLAALGRLAGDVRGRLPARVVAITGSAGKTSTKDILAALLRPVAATVATEGNFNNEVGVPLTLLDADALTQVVVTELAMRGRGQIAELARIARPDVAVITNIAPVHLQLVGTVEDVAAAKAEIIDQLVEGTLVAPHDEPLLAPHLRRFRGRLITFGGRDADVHVVDAERRGARTHAVIDAFGRRAAFDFSFSGGHYLTDATAALGAFVGLGYALEEAKPGAARVRFSKLRGELSPLAGGGLLLNDAYNANPVSMVAAIEHLVSIAEGRPTLGMLGDMYELGPGAAAFHREVGAQAQRAGVRVVAVGELARDYLTGAPGERWFATVEDCLAALPDLVEPGSAVLVKASRALRLERVAEAILERYGESG
jgi:UDP-N-acetylmuramoyl-tripeptide--D-alanyl-D-alanine ligase